MTDREWIFVGGGIAAVIYFMSRSRRRRPFFSGVMINDGTAAGASGATTTTSVGAFGPGTTFGIGVQRSTVPAAASGCGCGGDCPNQRTSLYYGGAGSYGQASGNGGGIANDTIATTQPPSLLIADPTFPPIDIGASADDGRIMFSPAIID